MTDIKIPNKISPCPLIEAIVELRFNPSMPGDAVTGIIYSRFKERVGNKFEPLSIMELPEQIRKKDPNFRDKPYYKLSFSEDYFMKIGPHVISFNNMGDYLGWAVFYREIKEALKVIMEAEVVAEFTRVGIRYVNFFDLNIYDKINLAVTMNGSPFQTKQTTLRSVVETGRFLTNLQIVNEGRLKAKDGLREGSVVDIDTYYEGSGVDIFGMADGYIDAGHDEGKKLFFSLLQQDFIDSELNPEY